MSTSSNTDKTRSRPESELSRTTPDARNEQHKLRMVPSGSLVDGTPTHGVSNTDTRQAPGKSSGPGVQPQDGPSSHSGMSTDGRDQLMITSIRATDVALGIRRLPAGFYVMVHHSGLEWRTENKRLSVDRDIVEWSDPIPIPKDLSTTVLIEIYASFEFKPTLGAGEQLRKLTITVEQLSDRSARNVPFRFFPKEGDVISPCSSILVTVEQWTYESSVTSASTALKPHCSTAESRGEMEQATNRGHNALLRYQKHGEKWDLEHSIEEFKRALSVCPLDHPCRGVAQSNLAMAKFALTQGQHTDTFPSLSLYHSALDARPPGHVDRPSTLIQLAAVHLAQFEKSRDGVKWTWAKAFLHEAMELSPEGSHEYHAARFMLQLHTGRREGPTQLDSAPLVEQDWSLLLTDEELGTLIEQFLHRFQRFGDLADLEQAITLLKEFLRIMPVWDELYHSGLGNLGGALFERFKHLGELCNLEDAISTLRRAVELTPHGHPNKPAYLSNLGNCFRNRFEHLGELSDLEEAISVLRLATTLTPHGHPAKSACLSSLGSALRSRFQHLGELGDLEQAISVLRHAVTLTPHSHPGRPSHLNNLGSSLTARFERFGELNDLEEAISRQRAAVELTPHDHPDKPGHLSNLGNSFRARFERLGELSDLEAAISTLRNAADLIPNGHGDKPDYLGSLGNSFITRFQRLGELSDLEDAISMLRNAVDLIPNGHYHEHGYVNNLGTSFFLRFEHLEDLRDLEEAISTFRHAVELTPHDHPNKPSRLNNLGSCFGTRFRHLGELNDLEEAILMLRNAVRLTPCGHPHRPAYLNNLGSFFKTRFKRLGELSDLKEAISMQRDAIELTPHGHPHKHIYLSSLATSLQTRFLRLGELRDLEDAISILRVIVDETPHGHPHRCGLLNDLGYFLFIRFEQLGQLSDIEGSISTLRDAAELAHGHPRELVCLNNLGISLNARFDRLGELDDIEDAISRLRTTVHLTPHNDPGMPTVLNNLGNSFTTRFERLGDLSDLESGISILKDAIDLTPHGHPDLPVCLNSLGHSLRTRFERLRELGDLRDMVSTFKDAVQLTPHSHPEKSGHLNNLGVSFRSRFLLLGELSDLEGAISTLKDAVGLTPCGHPRQPGYLCNLGASFADRFALLGKSSDLEQAISSYFHAASSPFGPICIRFRASQYWISCARRIHHHSLLHAYSVAINLLPQLAWIGLSLEHRYSELTQGADVVREAAAAALDVGLLETAVEWLERGRSIVWGDMFQLRSSYEELSSAYPDHARRLQELSAALDHASATRERSLSALLEQTESTVHGATESSLQEADKHRTLAIERDKLLREVRRLPGFKNFLLQKEFSELRASAHSGPVVILNAAKTRCDALIVLSDVNNVIHVPLPKFTSKRSAGLRNMVEKLLGHARAIPSRVGKSAIQGGVSWESLLSALWKDVVKPVLDALAFSISGDISRIFWCPTGPFVFLPIHAAGIYGTQHSQPGYKVFDFVISSYVPTLSILTPSPNPIPVAVPSGNLRLLFVRQPSSDGLSRLPGAVTELEHVKAVINHSRPASTTLLESSVGTVEEVFSLMEDADWVHFACHGIQDGVNSGLCLAHRRRLKVRDIIGLSRPRGGLAFLSACQTAMGDERLSDEAIHIAAGMLFAGYGGVIGTMWSISDKLAPDVARDVYAQLFRNGTQPDYREAARALHEAIGRLRDSGQASFVTWLPFIHVGL